MHWFLLLLSNIPKIYNNSTKKKICGYLALSLFLIFAHTLFRGVEWQGSAQLHTVIEAVATILALFVGAMALVHYYSQKNIILLFVGVGFLGTSFLDGYHAVVTSEYFRGFMPSNLQSLIPWSWSASRLYLSLFLLLSWCAWYRQKLANGSLPLPEKYVYVFSFTFTIVTFLFFAFIPLPNAYYPEFIFKRPGELLPAALFAGALAGYFLKGAWRSNPFEHWLVCALIVSFFSQVMFMSFSTQLFDFEFDIAHLLKKASYIFVLAGLLQSMYFIFKNEVHAQKKLKISNDHLEKLVEERTEHLASSEARFRSVILNMPDAMIISSETGNIETINPAVTTIFGFRESELLGKNINILLTADTLIPRYQALKNRGMTKSLEIMGSRKDGARFPVESTCIVIEVNGKTKFVNMVRDVSERYEHEKRLNIAREKAEAASIAKSEFLANMSHEIRTPMNGVYGTLQLLKGEQLSEKGRDLINKAEFSSKNLLTIINDILDFSKIEAGQLDLENIPFNLKSVIESVSSDMLPQAIDKNISFEVNNNITHDMWIGDPIRVGQVMLNLVSNAIKFTEHGKITLSLFLKQHALSDNIVIEIVDTGIGMDKKAMDMLFLRFRQADDSITRRYGGTGLGMSITQSLVNLMNGQISVDSEVNKGTTIQVMIPLKKAQGTVDDLASTATSESKLNLAGKHILIAEDNAINQTIIETILEPFKATLTIVANGEEAVKSAFCNRPDLILMDIQMPVKDGVTACREILSQMRDVPIVALTANVMAQDIETYLNAGFVAHLGKPFEISALQEKLKQLLLDS